MLVEYAFDTAHLDDENCDSLNDEGGEALGIRGAHEGVAQLWVERLAGRCERRASVLLSGG